MKKDEMTTEWSVLVPGGESKVGPFAVLHDAEREAYRLGSNTIEQRYTVAAHDGQIEVVITVTRPFMLVEDDF